MTRIVALACVFLLSGASALVFETLWFREAGLLVGNSVWAATLVLSAFMAGMAIGSWAAARWGTRTSSGLRTYAALEITIAVVGVLLVWFMPQLGGLFVPLARPLAAWPVLLHTLRFGLAFTLLLVPSAAMGMSLPLLTRAAAAWDANFGRSLGLLYGANTLGAVFGAVLAELWLVERFGIRGTAGCAAGLSAVAGVLAWGLDRAFARSPRRPDSAADSGEPVAPPSAAVGITLGASFVAGLLLLGLEVVWLRVLVLLLNDTPLAFATILALVLSGIALGGFATALCISRWRRAADYAWLAAYACGAFGLAGYWLYPRLMVGRFPAYQPLHTIAAIGAPLVLPTSFMSGVLFTLLGARLRRFTRSNSEAAGLLGFANTLGAAFGPMLAGFVLLPELGMERALLCLLASYCVVGFALAYGNPLAARVRYSSALVVVAGFALFPYGKIESWYLHTCTQRWMHGEARLVHVEQGATATIMHIVHDRHAAPLFDQIATNAYSMTVNSFAGRRYMKACVYLPVALHPRLERALVVGFGIGNTAKALTDTPELKSIDIVDISRDMLDASRWLQVSHGSSPLDDPRVHVHIEDGRFYLRATERRYDLITGEPPPPVIAGVVNLYTTEYFKLVRSRLAPGGFATYWLPIMNISASATKSLIRGFCDAFADCSLWHGAGPNLMLMGTRDARGPVTAERFSEAWNDPARTRERITLGFELPAQLGALFVGDSSYLRELTADAEPLTDDRPKRLQGFVSKQEQANLTTAWRDAHAAHERFQHSPWVSALFPAAYRQPEIGLFEVQSLMDDLLSLDATALRNTQVLHQLLRRTRLRVPILLLMNSDPDVQDALARLSPDRQQSLTWRVERAASKLADHDLVGALELLSDVDEEAMPIPQLCAYLDYSIQRAEQQQP